MSVPTPVLPHVCTYTPFISSCDFTSLRLHHRPEKKKSGKDSLSFIWTNLYPDEAGNSQGNLELLFLTLEEETEINFVPLELVFLFLELLLCY